LVGWLVGWLIVQASRLEIPRSRDVQSVVNISVSKSGLKHKLIVNINRIVKSSRIGCWCGILGVQFELPALIAVKEKVLKAPYTRPSPLRFAWARVLLLVASPVFIIVHTVHARL